MPVDNAPPIQRVRAILLTENQEVVFIKRIKPNKPQPYWVAPGGGVESIDDNLEDALYRELYEELGANIDILEHGFVLEHTKADKVLEEHFFICWLQDYDLSKRHGPEFDDPSRGRYIPDFVPLSASAIRELNIITEQLQKWLLNNLVYLRQF